MKPVYKRFVDSLLTASIGKVADLTWCKAEESGAKFCMQNFIMLSIFGSSGEKKNDC